MMGKPHAATQYNRAACDPAPRRGPRFTQRSGQSSMSAVGVARRVRSIPLNQKAIHASVTASAVRARNRATLTLTNTATEPNTLPLCSYYDRRYFCFGARWLSSRRLVGSALCSFDGLAKPVRIAAGHRVAQLRVPRRECRRSVGVVSIDTNVGRVEGVRTGFLDPPRNDNRREGLPPKNHTRVSAIRHRCRRWLAPLGALFGLR